MKLSIVTLASLAFLTLATLASADPKPRKSQALKVHLCEAIDVYTGAVDANHPSTRIAESCSDVSIASAQKRIAKCAAQGAESCEVILSADKRTTTLEHKILVSQESE